MATYVPDNLRKRLATSSDFLRHSLGSLTWSPAVSLCRSAVLSTLQRIQHGRLLILDTTTLPSKTKHVFGEHITTSDGDLVNGVRWKVMKRMAPQVELIVKKESFWVRVAMFGDMGFAEAWMLGEVECDGLTSFFELFIYNRDFLCNGSSCASYASLLTTPLTSFARNTNTLTNALLNVSAHYDISNAMFAAFLSSDMTYSCPIWRLSPRPGEPAEALEAAQMTKLHHIIGLLKLKMSDHVLEIGTGWGSFAIEAVRKTACKVTTLTLSTEQKLLAEERIEAAGLSSHITVLLCDYRSLATPEKPYDKLVSIEMLEAVGREYLTPYFACVDRFLKKQGGIAVFQCITMPEHRYAAYARSEDFIRKYIFPGGHLPSATLLLRSIEKGSKGSLIPEKLENIGGHYARALRLWREAFTKNFESKIAPALREQHDDIDEDEIEVFKRKWIYYFTYCEAGFATKTLGDVIITVGREGAPELMEGIPL